MTSPYRLNDKDKFHEQKDLEGPDDDLNQVYVISDDEGGVVVLIDSDSDEDIIITPSRKYDLNKEIKKLAQIFPSKEKDGSIILVDNSHSSPFKTKTKSTTTTTTTTFTHNNNESNGGSSNGIAKKKIDSVDSDSSSNSNNNNNEKYDNNHSKNNNNKNKNNLNKDDDSDPDLENENSFGLKNAISKRDHFNETSKHKLSSIESSETTNKKTNGTENRIELKLVNEQQDKEQDEKRNKEQDEEQDEEKLKAQRKIDKKNRRKNKKKEKKRLEREGKEKDLVTKDNDSDVNNSSKSNLNSHNNNSIRKEKEKEKDKSENGKDKIVNSTDEKMTDINEKEEEEEEEDNGIRVNKKRKEKGFLKNSWLDSDESSSEDEESKRPAKKHILIKRSSPLSSKKILIEKNPLLIEQKQDKSLIKQTITDENSIIIKNKEIQDFNGSKDDEEEQSEESEMDDDDEELIERQRYLDIKDPLFKKLAKELKKSNSLFKTIGEIVGDCGIKISGGNIEIITNERSKVRFKRGNQILMQSVEFRKTILDNSHVDKTTGVHRSPAEMMEHIESSSLTWGNIEFECQAFWKSCAKCNPRLDYERALSKAGGFAMERTSRVVLNDRGIRTEFETLYTIQQQRQMVKSRKLRCYPNGPRVMNYFEFLELNILLREEIPHERILKNYQMGKEAYGEVMPKLVNQWIMLGLIKPTDIFCDIGCGIGNILFQVAAMVGCRVIGVELRPDLFAISQRMLAKYKRISKWKQLDSCTQNIEIYNVDIASSTLDFNLYDPTLFFMHNTCFPTELEVKIMELMKQNSQPEAKVITINTLCPRYKPSDRGAKPWGIFKTPFERYEMEEDSLSWKPSKDCHFWSFTLDEELVIRKKNQENQESQENDKK
ncbi:hypothetical protein CYY_000191 [Polysphondylium violaceum]|uniref:Histone-lysine N-methyltransferase, H3 lysine-79 specific n=1 Tax=Polysphondylium violaceum TaxID=133409 RepID=A0A8J4V5Y7_9MYCE|nr:hypothetical protein CYY_000191 [Polysphondylium violaceum]